MRLQLIASAVTQIPEPLGAVKELYVKCEALKEVKTEADIDALNALLSIGLPEVRLKQFEPVNLSGVEARFKITKAYYDPNSVHDNFI
jgi:hypothetical protein